MSATMTDSSFQFVVSNGPQLSKDPAVRTLIRKQAMKDVGMARRKKGNYGRINMRQYPVFEDTSFPIRSPVGRGSSNDSSSGASSRTQGTVHSLTPCGDIDEHAEPGDTTLVSTQNTHNTRISRRILPMRKLSSHPDYERVRARFGLDLTDLSFLTNFNAGTATTEDLSADSSRLASILDPEQWSFLDYVPSRYGTSECLTSAVDVLLARAHLILTPHKTSIATCDRLYGKALRSLQGALGDDSSAVGADALCATQLLGLHEVRCR